ncbi:hypothetical protein F4781DRAFT_126636 [Annulohypoxylon bovei var. microspora]|nr:hypothetical protein F4781DRAFT_126636 [Annulohypoxylon bovei var. microspora]
MGSLSTFHLFNELPKELRLLIWEYHFESHRVHVVHPAPENENINAKKEVLSYRCTVLDPATNVIVEDARPPSPLVNREAHEVLDSCKRAWIPITFNKDLAESMTLAGSGVPPPFSRLVASQSVTRRGRPEAQERPVYVDWGRDMLYICASHTEQAFWSLCSAPWRGDVQKLALLVPQSGFHGAIPFGPTAVTRGVFHFMQGLEELFVVLIPQAGTTHSDDTSKALAGLHRDIHGFVPYVKYLKEAGLATNHMLYNRTAMLLREATSSAPRKVKLERVVDVDYLTGPFGHYRRNVRLPFASTAST